jgi:hypothetical protein
MTVNHAFSILTARLKIKHNFLFGNGLAESKVGGGRFASSSAKHPLLKNGGGAGRPGTLPDVQTRWSEPGF